MIKTHWKQERQRRMVKGVWKQLCQQRNISTQAAENDAAHKKLCLRIKIQLQQKDNVMN